MVRCRLSGPPAGLTITSSRSLSETAPEFKFTEYAGKALLQAIKQALHHYMDERIWKRIQLNGMAKDFSWKASAREYAKLSEAARSPLGAGQTVRNQTSVATSN